MDSFINIFNIVLYQPLLNVLVLLYKYLPGHDFGVAVIVLTILVKFLFYPLGAKAIKSQKALTELQPKVKEIQEKYKDNKEKQARETMALYRKEKISPFSGCLPLLIQLPVLIALYRVFWRGFQLEEISSHLYSFVSHIEAINPSFFGIIDLSRSYFIEIEGVRHYLWANIILIILVGVTQFLQTKMSMSKNQSKKTSGFSGQMQKQMQYFMPAFIVLILFRLPAAVGLYWLTTTLFTIIQQYFLLKKPKQVTSNK